MVLITLCIKVVDEEGLRAKGAEAYATFDALRTKDQKLCVHQPLCTMRNCKYRHLKEFEMFTALLKVRPLEWCLERCVLTSVLCLQSLPKDQVDNIVQVFVDTCHYGFPILTK
jgi:hypothetical protein